MKKHLLTSVFLITIIAATAQNVGIGTTTPNVSALLDLSSTTKGFLLPRVTTTQMFNIDNPATGLMVFNSTYNQLYHYDGSTWRSVLNGTHWSRPLASRDIMSNTSDSIGIGVSIPTRFVDVDGTMRVRGTLTADGTINSGGLLVSGNILAGSGLVNGSLQTNDQLLINNPSGIIQLSASSVNKGFIQLSGDDLRLGTNSGNDNGKFVVRTNGADRLSVDNAGVVNITNKITSDRTGAHSLLPLCWGTTWFDTGNLRRGTGNVTVTRREKGIFRITCEGIINASCVMLTPGASGLNASFIFIENGIVDVILRVIATREEIDHSFSFIIY